MKKLLCFLLALLILIPAAAAADPSLLMFSTYGSTEKVEHLFTGSAFALDLIMGDDLKAVFIETVWENGKIYTKSYPADIKSLKGDTKFLYFVLENDFTIKGHYDDNGLDFWVDYAGGSVKLHYIDEFNPFFDYMGER